MHIYPSTPKWFQMHFSQPRWRDEKKNNLRCSTGSIRAWFQRTVAISMLILLALGILAVSASVFGFVKVEKASSRGKCLNPRPRMEWRSLLLEEKMRYIEAVQCLENTRSTLTGKGSLYDDFVYVHMWAGQNTHAAASFLPWHRAFLHIYESTLHQQCGYTGVLPFWAWDLDWKDLSSSSIWDSIEGFGGDGDINGIPTPGAGRCVIDGPFKNSQRLYFDRKVYPHCLGRGFIHFESQKQGLIDGYWFRPEQMGRLRRSTTYDEIRELIEATTHNALHWGVGGDFTSFTAGNDPIFFLHHGQLDKLWWDWQQGEIPARWKEYEGKSFNTTEGSDVPGTLDDKLTFMGLWEDIQISQVMRADGGLLCYRYV